MEHVHARAVVLPPLVRGVRVRAASCAAPSESAEEFGPHALSASVDGTLTGASARCPHLHPVLSGLSSPPPGRAEEFRPYGLSASGDRTLTGASASCPHLHPVISGMSPPYREMCSWCSMSLSRIACLAYAALGPSFGTRSITSLTKWKRSRSFSTHISNGVLVVPSSLYPRTCGLRWGVRR